MYKEGRGKISNIYSGFPNNHPQSAKENKDYAYNGSKSQDEKGIKKLKRTFCYNNCQNNLGIRSIKTFPWYILLYYFGWVGLWHS